MTTMRITLVPFVVLAFALTGCSKSASITAPDTAAGRAPRAAIAGGERARPAPVEGHVFVPRSDNPFFPLVPGTEYHYRSETEDGIETGVVTVTHRTLEVGGVTTLVVRDVVRLDGKVIERTTDYFAMDELGNVWYFGEDARSIDPETGEVSSAGSWRAGVDGAQAGIIMEAQPRVGDKYDEENAPGVAEDQAKVMSLDASASVPYGTFANCLKTRNTTPLEPDVLENKIYAPGVGLVLEIDVADGGIRNELVKVSQPGSASNDGEADHDRGVQKVR